MALGKYQDRCDYTDDYESDQNDCESLNCWCRPSVTYCTKGNKSRHRNYCDFAHNAMAKFYLLNKLASYA